MTVHPDPDYQNHSEAAMTVSNAILTASLNEEEE